MSAPSAMPTMSIEPAHFLSIRNIWKRYGAETVALKGVSLDVQAGEIVCLVGPSGCGKTTLLRIVAGLETPDEGTILLEGQNLLSQPVHTRGFGLMFQEFALFPDKSVAQNIAFGLRMQEQSRKALDREEIAARVDEMLALVNLRGYGARSIFALSGGERQRVALARSLAPQPRLLMLDEPLGSLDRALRETLMDDLREILKRLGLTALYVTHDQQEALAVSDRVVVMNRGSIVQIGAPRAVWQTPASEFVARFLGFQNLMPAQVRGEAPAIAETAIGKVQLAAEYAPGEYVLLIRSDALKLGEPATGNHFHGTIQETSFRGTHLRAQVTLANRPEAEVFVFHLPPDTMVATGEKIAFSLDPTGCILISASE